ncbi:unnamed protein product [Cyclocybe aegerita]|uniref:Uncharacterized protein n=1 Tax=Cyclocybe aegerita TaxID=1973307 RepID=A0A8S0VY62_CYCAE|nr:unnamed protein product [Cyclocybe aegerita]
MQAVDDLGRPASPSHIPASKKRKGVDRLVPPPPQKKSKVAYSCPGLPLLINHTTKPKPHPTTWAGIARQAALMPPLPPGLGPQHRRPSPPPSFPTGPMKTSTHHSIPSFTSEGPTRKQVLVSFGGTPPNLTKFFTKSAVRAANGYLRDGRSMLKVTSIVHAYALLLVTPAVASPSDLDILHNFIHKSLPTAPSEILISMPRLEHDLQGPSDHVPICTDLDIGPEPPGSGRRTIKPGTPVTKEGIEALADAIAMAFSDVWLAHSTESKPTKRSKYWWTDECSEKFGVYQLSRSLADYNKFKKVSLWDLMEWVKQHKLPPCEAIHNGDQPCHDMDDLWDTLHSTYNLASGCEYNTSVLDELPDEPVSVLDAARSLSTNTYATQPGY